MVSFPSKNDKRTFSEWSGVLKKQSRMMANQHIFAFGLTVAICNILNV